MTGMSYAVKEIFYTLQGEGANSGRPAVFCRFAGCNLWSGLEKDRAAAICRFCDTDFVGTDGGGGGKFATPTELARAIATKWPDHEAFRAKPLVVCTGGEPLLQLDSGAIEALHDQGFEIAVETNGTLPAIPGIDWVCVSPKAGAGIVVRSGDELKVVFPQEGLDPACFETWDFQHFYVQPMDGPHLKRNTQLALEYSLTHPQWKVSVQTHKVLGIA